MADYQKVEINEPTQAEIEPNQQQATEAEEPQAQQERPEWLPEKFESAEDLAKAYGELESKMGTGAKEEEPEQQVEEQQEEKPEQSENEFTETQKLISDASKHTTRTVERFLTKLTKLWRKLVSVVNSLTVLKRDKNR